MIAEIYVEVDDFCKSQVEKISDLIGKHNFFENLYKKRRLSKRITMGEIMTILIYYHYSDYKNFKCYYTKYVVKELKNDFTIVSYNRFVWWIPLALIPLACFVMWNCCNGRRTGIYFIDSTKISACNNRRVHMNKVFKGFASWGKTSMGWFWGFKLHLLVNQYGELMNCRFTTGSVSDNNTKVLFHLTNDINGWIIGDKGYLCNKDKKDFVEKEGHISLFAKPRKNQKTKKAYYDRIPFLAKLWARKRGLVETVIGLKKEQFNLEHTRHRSIFIPIPKHRYGITHMYAALAAYYFRANKPNTSINLEQYLLPHG